MSRKQADKAAVDNIKALGGDTEKEQPVEFFLYFPTEWDACVAKSCLMNLQFSTSIHYSESSDNWLCLAKKKIKPTSARLMELGNFFEQLAVGNNGNYDGWETPVVQADKTVDE
jgi:hypothetical protein